ncbi:sn-glycerol-3-phosphate transport system permease protein UgpA [Roseibium sp. TrichSKD4]|uniref:ABC transporter permease subunit n=1 Tax=Roseibium sp. TrichSKD4 TaxID=744980 RepID=UPI0001E56778|nr:ABC transporter permease subunit [Roseibium sp. TrichSKD4]EFO32869.1 sn-glycerol-3-phosphate transport system permease protein UgpA [Roseibium sp. TrichSKD4]
MKKVRFQSGLTPYLLLLPQLAIVVVFFLWPAAEAVRASFYLEDPFGFGSTFVGMDNFVDTVTSTDYSRVAKFTAVFTTLVTFLSLGIALLLAVKADKVLRGASTYKTLLMWVYAVAPPVAGLIGVLLFDQHVGPLTDFFGLLGWEMQIGVSYFDTAFAMTATAVWKQIPVNFIFFLSGLQGIPKSVQEAASIDCRSGFRRFWTVTFPLLAPTGFFLLIINITYAFFDTFGIVDVIVKQEPGNNPVTLVYKVFLDGFRGNDLGGSSAQSVILMALVFILTVVQFRLIERRVHYT